MVGLTPTVVTRREETNGYEKTKEPGEIFTTRIHSGGMELDTSDDANFASAIMFNTKITEMEYRTNKKMRRHITSSYCYWPMKG